MDRWVLAFTEVLRASSGPHTVHLRKARLAHGVAVASSKNGGIIFAAGGSAEVRYQRS